MGKPKDIRCEKTGVIFDVSIKRLFVKDIKTLTNDQIFALNAGDEVVKETGNQKHTYIVSYKEDRQGMCLTYTDASVVETVSYDLIDGVWTYNSTDSTSITGGSGGGTTYEAGTGIDITGSTISVDNTVAMKTDIKRYKHFIHLTFLDGCAGDYTIDGWVVLENKSSTQYTATTFKALFNSADIEIYGANHKIMTTISNQYYLKEYSPLMACCYAYNSTDDCFDNEGEYSNGLTLATISDTVSEIQ